MRKIIVITIAILSICLYAYADLPIYCPKCKTHLYDYQKDTIKTNEIIYAKDFKPVIDIPQPTEYSAMKCPLCKASLNGWQYYGEYHNSKSHVVASGIISLLTKLGNEFVWLPHKVPDVGIGE